MTDQNRKTLRSFYCRDYLWEHFEQMAQELGCSMDYLINESMRLYARSRDQSAGANPQGGPIGSGAPNRSGAGPGGQQGAHLDGSGYPVQNGGEDMNHRTFERVPAVGNNRQQPKPPQAQPQPPQSQPQAPRQSPSHGVGSAPQQRGPGGPPPPPPRPSSGGSSAPPNQGPQNPSGNWQPQSGPPQPPGNNFGGDPGFGAGPGANRQPIYLSFNNNRYVVEKDKFVIGRGSKQTDLTIRDGNISRKHCAVIYRNGAYYIKDLGSTNGIEYRGNRIESKKIEEGDVFYLCDYELRFSNRG